MSYVEKNAESTQWHWRQFAIAVGLIPLSFLMWLFGLSGVWRSHTAPPIDPNPGWTLICNVIMRLSPFVALAGVTWVLVLCVHAARQKRRRARIVWVLLVVFVIYPLSSGPAYWLCENARVSHDLLLVYVPVFLLCELFPPLRTCLSLYVSLFGTSG
jgi:hypothetical protein